MKLYLMRHADAVAGDDDDRSRVLSERGRQQAERVAGWLGRMTPRPVSVLTSPYPRASETAEIVAAKLSPVALNRDEALAPGMTVATGTALLHQYGSNESALFMVGHAPDLGELLAHLIGAAAHSMPLKKGALAHLDCMRPGFGGSALMWLVTPAVLG